MAGGRGQRGDHRRGPAGRRRAAALTARLVLDRRTRLHVGPGGGLVVGGQPRRALRLSPAGAAAVAGWRVGGPVAPEHLSLARRLHDAGAGVLVAPPVWRAEDVTVVVPVRDRPEQLARCLRALAGCRVVVVDDASAEPVPGALRLEVNRGPAGARNAGLPAVSTPLVAFVDSDCEVPPGWLDGLLPHLQDGVAAVAPRVVGAGGPGLLARFEQASGPLDLGPDPAPVRPRGRVGHVPAAVLLARVEALGAGFAEDLRVGEDVDLVWRLAAGGQQVRYVPDVVVRHGTRPDPASWWRQRAGYGRSAALLDARHPGQVAPAVLPPRLLPAVLLAPVAPRLAVAAAAASTAWTAADLLRRLPDAPGRREEAARLAVEAVCGAATGLAEAAARPWLPALLVGAAARTGAGPVARRLRRLAVAAVVVRLVRRAGTRSPGQPPALPLLPWAAVAVLDDLAYGTGVWSGALRHRRPDVLLPRRS